MIALEKIRDRNIVRIYAATLLIGLGYGISLSVTSLHLTARGFDKQAIGSLAAWFAGGLVALSLPMGNLIRRFTAKRVLWLALLGYAASIATFPTLETYPSLAAVRALDGACSVMVWVCSETLLLSRAAPEHKAFTLSLYTITIALGYVFGPLIARAIVEAASLRTAFSCASSLAVLSSLYVVFKLEPDRSPESVHEPHVSTGTANATGASSEPIGGLLRKIKNSCFATFCYGYFQATVVLFLPIYLMESKAVPAERTILIPAFFAAGMLLFSNLAGRAGDRFGHLRVMRLLAILGTTMILGFVYLDSYAWMCAAVFIAGASLASISPLSLALQGAQCDSREYARATAVYNTFYAAGILLGPPLASRIFAQAGGPWMLYHLAALWAAFIAFSLWFASDDPRHRASAAVPSPGSN